MNYLATAAKQGTSASPQQENEDALRRALARINLEDPDADIDKAAALIIERLRIDIPPDTLRTLTLAMAKTNIVDGKGKDRSSQSTHPTTSESDQEGTSGFEFSKREHPGAVQATWSTDSQSSPGLSGNESHHEQGRYDATATASPFVQKKGEAALLNQQRSAKNGQHARAKGVDNYGDLDGQAHASCSPIRPKNARKAVGAKRTPTNTRGERHEKRSNLPVTMFGGNNMAYVTQTNTGLSTLSEKQQQQPARLFNRILCGKSQKDMDFPSHDGIPNSMQFSHQHNSPDLSFDTSFHAPPPVDPARSTTPAATQRVQAPNSPSRPGLQEKDDMPDLGHSSSRDRKPQSKPNYKFPSSEGEDGTEPIAAPPRTSTSPGDQFGPNVQTVDSQTTSSSVEYSSKTPSHRFESKDAGDFSFGTPMDFSFIASPPVQGPSAQKRDPSSTAFPEHHQRVVDNAHTPAAGAFRSSIPSIPLQQTPATFQHAQPPIQHSQPCQVPQHSAQVMQQAQQNQPPVQPRQHSMQNGLVPQVPVQASGAPTQSASYVQPGPSMQHAYPFQPANVPAMQGPQGGAHPSSHHSATQQPPQAFQSQPAQGFQPPAFSIGSDKSDNRKGFLKARLHKPKGNSSRGPRAVQFPKSGGQVMGASSSGSVTPTNLPSVSTTQLPLQERVPSPMNIEEPEPGFSLGTVKSRSNKSRFKLPNKTTQKSNHTQQQPSVGMPAGAESSQPIERPHEIDFSHVLALVDSKKGEADDAAMRQEDCLSVQCYTTAIQTYRSLVDKPFFDGDKMANLLDNRAMVLMRLGAVQAAVDDCREAVNFVSDGGAQGERFSAHSGPPFKVKVQKRLVQALFKRGLDREAREAAEAALNTSKQAAFLAMRLLPKQQADECIQMLGHTEREIDLTLKDLLEVQRNLDKVRQLLSSNNVNTSMSFLDPLKHVNLALMHEDASDELIGTKVRLLIKMKRWREVAGVLERYAALKVQFDELFVGDLEPKNPFPGVEPALHLKLDFFNRKLEEDLVTAEKKLNSKAVGEAILRLPYGMTQIYVRALRLEERYPAAECALDAIGSLVESKEFPTEMKQQFNWIAEERDRLNRTKEGREKGDKFFKDAQFEEAANAYAKCLEIDNKGQRGATDGPNAGGRLHAVLHCNRAAALMAMSKYEEALVACSAAIQIHSRYMKATLRRARCYARVMRFSEAISEYNRWLELVESEKKKNGPQTLSACLFDCPKDASEKDINIVRRELESVHLSKRRAEAAVREQNSRSKQGEEKWTKAFSNARTAQDRREEWYKQDSRRWDSFASRGPNRGPSRPKEYKRSSSTGHGVDDDHSKSNYRSHSEGRPRQHASGLDINSRDHYAVLQISVHATEAQINKAYRKMALIYHPDKNKHDNAEDQFRRLQEARDVLTDSVKRRMYDRERGHMGRRH